MGEKNGQQQQSDPYGMAIVQAQTMNQQLDELIRKRRLAPASVAAISVRSCQAGEKLPGR
jgi:low affinity Fe/Cu permease